MRALKIRKISNSQGVVLPKEILANQGFVDGNKRTAYVTARLFLELNGYTLTAPAMDRVQVFVAVGAGHVSETELTGAAVPDRL